MDFALDANQRAIVENVAQLCDGFDLDYWRKRDADGGFPHDFHAAIARAGYLGVAMPPQFGGAGLGMTEAVLVMQAISQSGAGLSGASAVHMNIFGLHPVVVFGTAEQQARWLPPLIRGEHKACFGVTEPNAGLNTLKLETRAVRDGEHYVVRGQKIWISTAQVAHKILLLARTTPIAELTRPSEGLTLFYTDLDRSCIEVREIDKLGRACVDSNQLFIDGLRIPIADRIGDEGKGFQYILHGFNPERMLIAAEAVGLGRAAIKLAAKYATERIVFDRPIGMNQAIQHPLAQRWMELEAANLMVLKAAWLHDRGQPCAAEANAAKYLAGEAGYRACETAVMTHGGMGYAKDYHVERFLRESLIPRIAPVSREMIMSFIAEKVLDLPRSY
ncbi:MAG TPA: acyl-CoA dehydrogenase family protein [Kofleriaceae bacterium]